MSALYAGAAFLAALGALLFFARRAGRTEEKLTKEEEINDAVRMAISIRNRLHGDSDFAKRVRARFRR